MSRDERESFLARWSRRKQEPGRAADPAPRAEMYPAAADGAKPVQSDLPALDTLEGLNSEYREFLRPDVDEGVRRSALKKLFSDPHFNQMDGLDTYIDDYSIENPIPDAILRGLTQARSLLLFDGENEAETAGATPLESDASGVQPQHVAIPSTLPEQPASMAEFTPDQIPAGAKRG